MMYLRQASMGLRPWQSLARTMLALAFIGVASVSIAEEEVKLGAAQAQALGVRTVHPVSSRTDQTLPYPAQIVIPTPQLWVVSAPAAGMVTNLSVARGDRVIPASRWSPSRARALCRCNATTCMPSRRTCLPPSS